MSRKIKETLGMLIVWLGASLTNIKYDTSPPSKRKYDDGGHNYTDRCSCGHDYHHGDKRPGAMSCGAKWRFKTWPWGARCYFQIAKT